MLSTSPTTTATTWHTYRTAAAHTHVRPITLKRAVAAGRLRAFKVNGLKHVRFRQDDLDAWMMAAPIEVR